MVERGSVYEMLRRALSVTRFCFRDKSIKTNKRLSISVCLSSRTLNLTTLMITWISYKDIKNYNIMQYHYKFLINRYFVIHLDKQVPLFVFHINCGTNIRLTNNKTTARLNSHRKYRNGVVVSRDAMAMDVLYEVRWNDRRVELMMLMWCDGMVWL